jgi:hypothetical protein
MADISKLNLNNTILNLKDKAGREQIVSMQMDLLTINHPNNRFEEKDLGTWSSSSDVDTFFNTYNTDNGYDNLSLGNYVSIASEFGTNVWMIAGFDIYKGIGSCTSGGIVLIPKTYLSVSNTTGFTMNSSATTSGGYNSTVMGSTTLVNIGTQLQSTLGSSHLKNLNILVSSSTNASATRSDSLTGAATNCGWINRYVVLPTEIQIFGSNVWGNSFDAGELIMQLPIFRFISPNEYAYWDFWLRAVASSTDFAYASQSGDCWHRAANTNAGIRPLIYVG